MKKYFSFLKTKKYYFLIFLVFIALLLVLPRITVAVNGVPSIPTASSQPAPAQPAAESSSWWDSINPFSWFKDALASITNGLLFAMALLPLVLSAVLADICTVLFKFFLDMTTGGNLSYTANSAVKIGWPLVRDLANMVIVLGFVIIGVATALRVKEYEAKQLLSKLIIVALFVNFSLLICGVVIDISNILVNFFAQVGDLSDFGKFFNNSGINMVLDLAKNITKDNPIAFLVKSLSIVVFNLVLVAVLSLYTLLFAFRVVAIWLLVILAPLAFVFSVFPATRKFYEMWINNFIQWCFIGVPATFFLYLAHQSMAELTKTPVTFESLGTFSQSLTNFASLIVPAIFLIMGFLMTIQASSALAGGGLVKWAGGKAKMGGMALGRAVGVNTEKAWKATGGKLAGSLGNKMQGLGKGSTSKIGQNAGWLADKVIGGGLRAAADPRATVDKRRSALGRLADKAGLRPDFTQVTADSKRVEERAKTFAIGWDYSKEEKQKIRNLSLHGTGVDQAAAMNTVIEKKDINDTFDGNLALASQKIEEASKFGGGSSSSLRKKVAQFAPAMQAENTPVWNKIKTQHPGWTDNKAKHEAVVIAAAKMPEDSLDMDLADSIDHIVIRDMGPRMTRRKKEAFKRNTIDAIQHKIDAIRTANPAGYATDSEYVSSANKLLSLRNL